MTTLSASATAGLLVALMAASTGESSGAEHFAAANQNHTGFRDGLRTEGGSLRREPAAATSSRSALR